MEKSQLIGKDPVAGKYWRQKEKGAAEDQMVGWHHQLKEHEFEQTWGDSEGQGSLARWSPWINRVRHDLVTEQQFKTVYNGFITGKNTDLAFYL